MLMKSFCDHIFASIHVPVERFFALRAKLEPLLSLICRWTDVETIAAYFRCTILVNIFQFTSAKSHKLIVDFQMWASNITAEEKCFKLRKETL